MQPEQETKDQVTMTTAQRWAGMYTVVLMLLLLGYFIYHQRTNTGFFTPQFGVPEMVALYGPILISLAPPVQRLIQGKRNPARPLEVVTDLSLAFGSLWLWNHFAFDFSHLGDPLPPPIQFAFDWINNDVGRFILLLQIVLGFLSGLATIGSYFKERQIPPGERTK